MAKDKEKHLIPCFKGIDAYDMPKEFARLQAQDLGKVGAMQDLLRGIEKILPKQKPVTVVQEKIIVQGGSSGGNGGPDTASLLKRAFMFLEDGNWQDANAYCEKVLDIDPENALAYVGKLMAELRVQRRECLKDQRKLFDTRSNYLKAIRFADLALKDELEGYLAHIHKRLQNAEIEATYQNACSAMQNEEYEEAINLFGAISGYEDSDKCRQLCQKKYQELLDELNAKREEVAVLSRRIHINSNFAVGINENGTLVNTDPYVKEMASGWQNLIAVTAVCNEDIFALRADGTVISNEMDSEQDFDQMYFVEDWKNIISIIGGSEHLLGLKKDGTVLATGNNDHGECEISRWRDIVQISAGSCVSVGLKKNGTVVVTGFAEGLDELKNWTDIVAISCGTDHVLGLKANGTVVAAGENKYGQCNVSAWKNIVAISAGEDHSLGLTKEHAVVATKFIKTGEPGDISDFGQCDVGAWKNIVAVCAGDAVSLGITLDGYAVATGCVENCSCYVSDWKLFGTLISDREKLAHQSAQKRVNRLKELTLTRNEISEKIRDVVQERDSLTSFFAGKRRKELEKQREALYAQDDKVLNEIRTLIDEEEKQQAERHIQ
jgi:alpha-tubulin suppressor-like RCC1 family protein